MKLSTEIITCLGIILSVSVIFTGVMIPILLAERTANMCWLLLELVTYPISIVMTKYICFYVNSRFSD